MSNEPTTLDDIQRAVDDLMALMVKKGLAHPEAMFKIKAHRESSVILFWKPPTDGQSGVEVYRTFAEAFAAVSEMPDKAQRDREAFLAKLGATIEFGRSINIETDFVNPLVATMKRLSENVITHQAAS